MVDLADGSMMTGSLTLWNQTISMTLPSGEVAHGVFFSLSSADISEDSLFHKTNLGTLLGGHISGRFHGYAQLSGSNDTSVEIIFATDWVSGFGFARTSRGQEYRVSF